MLLFVLLFLNTRGNIVVRPDIYEDGKFGPHFSFVEQCKYGWPFTFVRRAPVALDRPPCSRLSHWNILEGVDQFSALSLIANAVVAFAVMLVGGASFELWRRQRERLVQFHIIDLAILTAILVAYATFYVFHWSHHRHERNILEAIANAEEQRGDDRWDIRDRVEWQPGGSRWLRRLIGDLPFRVFDTVVGFDTRGGEELQYVAGLRNLRVVRIKGAVTNGQLRLLEQLPHLEALSMAWTNLDQEVLAPDGDFAERCFQLPQLPHLRGLNLYNTDFRGDGLENIPRIEVLDLSRTDIDDESVCGLAALTTLKRLALYGTRVSDSAVSELRQVLPNCEIVR